MRGRAEDNAWLVARARLDEWPGYRDFADASGNGVTGEARSQLISEIMGIHRKDRRFVPGLQPLIQPKSFAKLTPSVPSEIYEGKRLNVYFV